LSAFLGLELGRKIIGCVYGHNHLTINVLRLDHGLSIHIGGFAQALEQHTASAPPSATLPHRDGGCFRRASLDRLVSASGDGGTAAYCWSL
jgi:hypothetical protein